MNQTVVHLVPGGPLMALVGNPNCGKTALFNLLTGSRQKVANYAGVTVERKEGRFVTPSGKSVRVLDLPGAYSLYPSSPDERVTCDVLMGQSAGEKRPDLVVCVVDAANLRRSLRLALAIKRLGLPCIVALNMADLAEKRGFRIVPDALAAELGMPVVSTVAVQKDGIASLLAELDNPDVWKATTPAIAGGSVQDDWRGDHVTVRRVLEKLGLDEIIPHTASDRIDRFTLHPVLGPILLLTLLFMVFQAVFSWAEAPMGWIEDGFSELGGLAGSYLDDDWVKSLLVDGIIAGVGAVLVFMPQILILFFFILVLEESGYLPRAAFLLDRLMGSVGLSGRSFIPLLSGFACAIPGIMATRTIGHPRDRLVTILIVPLMTCSARLPVYALLIGAFVPQREAFGIFQLQGLVLFALYLAGIFSGMLKAWLLKRFTAAGRLPRPLMMELPVYHLPTARNVAIGLWQRGKIFVRRVGGIILVSTILIWFLSSYPTAPEGTDKPAIEYSFAGQIGKAISPVFEPIGFNWQISAALIPTMAAREAVISSLGTVYSLSAEPDDEASAELALKDHIAGSWSLASALAMLAWFVFAPHCFATLGAVKRETGSWKIPLIMVGYLFALAYLAAFLTYRLAVFFGAG